MVVREKEIELLARLNEILQFAIDRPVAVFEVQRLLGVSKACARHNLTRLAQIGYMTSKECYIEAPFRNGVRTLKGKVYESIKEDISMDEYLNDFRRDRSKHEETYSYNFMPINLPSAVITLPDESICTRNKPVEPVHNKSKGITFTFNGGESSLAGNSYPF